MTRLYLIGGAVAALLTAFAAVYFLGARDARQGNALDRANDTINSGETFNEDARVPGACGWSDWLHDNCPD